GGILAALVVLVFLRNGRSTVIAALAIPTSIVSTFTLIAALGLTLNMITLLALTLSVGIVIDDAIVVLENIVRYVEEKGYSPRRAAVVATQEIGLAVLATSLSLVAVFLPIAFMSGIIGRFMGSFGFTMSFAIRLRWAVGLVLIGTLASIGPLVSVVPKNFLPNEDESRFEITLRAPEGTSLAQTQLYGERVARAVSKLPEVETIVLTVGAPA